MLSAKGKIMADIKGNLRHMTGWLLIATIVYAPWAYGCTRPATILGLDGLMGAVILCWLLALLAGRKAPVCPALMLGCVGWLLLQGWTMAFHERFLYSPETQMFHRNPAAIPFLPGSVDAKMVFQAMLRYTGLLGILIISADLMEDVRWRMRVFYAFALTGLSIVLLGLIQKVGGAKMVFWEAGRVSYTFFATYVYHGNAGAYLNLVLPFLIGATVMALRNQEGEKAWGFWVPGTMLCIISAFVNISKGAMVIAILILGLSAWGFASLGGRAILAFMKRHRVVPLAAGFAIILPIAIFFSSGTLRARWLQFFQQVGWDYPRYLTAKTCVQIIPQSGPFGFGPGTFEEIFPHYTNYLGNKIAGLWQYAHQDYLQMTIEWGWIGAVALGILLLGGMGIAIRQLFERKADASSQDKIALFCTVLALGGITLHAVIDFPLEIASLQFYVVIMLGICWNSPRWLRTRLKAKRRELLVTSV